MVLGNVGVDAILRQTGSLWTHSGDPKDPHALLTSGKHSDGFVNTLEALSHTVYCSLFADLMLGELVSVCNGWPEASWVVGSDHAAAAISHAVATALRARHDFCEKGPDKTQVWGRFVIKPEEPTLIVEDLVTTAGTVRAVRDGILAGNPSPVTFVPFVLVVVNRSDLEEIDDWPIVPLVHYNIKTWESDQCPLCAAGSTALRPKQNWTELTQGHRVTQLKLIE